MSTEALDLEQIWERMEDLRGDEGLTNCLPFHQRLMAECRASLHPDGSAFFTPFDAGGKVLLFLGPVWFDSLDRGSQVRMLYVAPMLRNHGLGKRTLEMLCRIADDTGEKLAACVLSSTDSPLSDEQLRDWTQKLGFTRYGFGADAEDFNFIRTPTPPPNSVGAQLEESKVTNHPPPAAELWKRSGILYHSDTSERTAEEVLEEAGKAKETAVAPIRECSMSYRWCYQNVERRVREQGGEMVLGWQMCGHRILGGGIELETHAVWRNPKGELVEVTRGKPSWLFVPSTSVVKNERASILTLDAAKGHAFHLEMKKQHPERISLTAANPFCH